MKILFVVPYTPNQIRVRPFQLLRALARRGHQVTLVTTWSSAAERDDLDYLAALGIRVEAQRLAVQRTLWNALTAFRSGLPLQALYAWQPTVARALFSLLRDPDLDVVHVEHLRGAQYGLRAIEWLRASGRLSNRPGVSRPVVIWDSVDCISHLFAQAARDSRSFKGRLMARLELERTRRYEARLVARFDRALVTSEVDRQALVQLTGTPASASVEVLPNGVDLEYFAPTDEPRDSTTLVMTGKMSYHANVTAALHLVHDIMPLVWAQRPDVRVAIVGKDPTRQVRALGAPLNRASPLQRDVSQGPSRPSEMHARVRVVGSVPDIRPYLRQATVAVAPVLYGAGIQNKVLEAMACGIPVVASAQAASALAAQPGRDLVLAPTAEQFADAVLGLLDAPARRRELGRAGRAYVERHHDWEAAAARLEQIYTATIDGTPRQESGLLAPVMAGGNTTGS
jgi:glycosyltransferase involved in cell wall biosynthesis